MQTGSSLVSHLILIAVVSVPLIGCQHHNTVLSISNVQQKFAEAESLHRQQPGQHSLQDFENLLGTSYPVDPKSPEFSDLPAVGLRSDCEWRQWVFGSQYLLVGFANDKSATTLRINR